MSVTSPAAALDSGGVSESSPLLGDASHRPGDDHNPPTDHSSETACDEESGPQTPLKLRLAAAMFSFAVMGLINASLGVMVTPVKDYYDLTDLRVSFMFLPAPIGYVAAALSVDALHLSLGQRGVAAIAPLCQLVAAAVMAFHPPFPVVLAVMTIGAFGTALMDGSWCTWAAGLKPNPNVVQGLLHGSYSTGACLGPFLSGSILELGQAHWYHWYAVVSGIIVVQFGFLVWSFRFQDAARAHRNKSEGIVEGAKPADQREMFFHLATWVCAGYFLVYIGTETAMTDWVVAFMIRARHASPYFSSLCSSAFGAGMAVGRFALGAVTDRVGLRPAVIVYLIAAIASSVLFALVAHPAASIVFISLTAVFIGPLFPSGIISLTSALPTGLHIPAVTFVATVGQIGGAIIPFGIGALVETLGITIFQTVIFGQLVATLAFWLMFPQKREGKAPEEREANDPETGS